jgi:hypothetical protein
MRRVILGILGAILILVGAGAAFSGAVLVGAFGPDGRVDSPTIRLTTSSAALTSDVARIDADLPEGVDLAQIHLSATSLEGGEVFIGVGPAREVLSYLAGSPYDVVSGVDGRTDSAELRRVSGTGTPPPPTSESFWLAQSFGNGKQTIDWDIAGGRYLFVVMNADGTAGVDVQARAGVSAPWIFAAGVGALAAGIVLVILGAVLLALGVRSPRKPVEAPVYATAAVPVGYQAVADPVVSAQSSVAATTPVPPATAAEPSGGAGGVDTSPEAPPREPGSPPVP